MRPNVFIIMGVSATGKTTLGKALAEATEGSFFDGDDFHPESNREKMSSGQPLDDSDRKEWLERLADLSAERSSDTTPTFIACSALKKSYRDLLRSKCPELVFVFLHTHEKILRERIAERYATGDHFMPPSMLDSQLETLEPPENAIELDASKPIAELIAEFSATSSLNIVC